MSFKSARYLAETVFSLTLLSFACPMTFAQEVVHALTGVVTHVDGSSHTITLKTSDGDQEVFQDVTARHPDFEFDKALQSDAISGVDFKNQGDHAIVYYFGGDQRRKVVALKDLGSAPLQTSSGQIMHWDRHHRLLTLKTASGDKQTFQLDDKTAIETPMGVVSGDKFDGQNGDQISIRYTVKGADNEAVFMNES
jgi:arginine repressor